LSKFEAELRLPCRQQFAYINIVVRADNAEELKDALEDATQGLLAQELAAYHGMAYDVVMGNRAKPAPSAQVLIESELGGKVIEQAPVTGDSPKPWERAKPAGLDADVKKALSSALDDF
jgi:hypothetical protein